VLNLDPSAGTIHVDGAGDVPIAGGTLADVSLP
jgi:hypothetical protein